MDGTIKAAAHQIVDELPDDASWGDLMYAIYVRQKIEAGLTDAAAGRKTPHEEVIARFRVP